MSAEVELPWRAEAVPPAHRSGRYHAVHHEAEDAAADDARPEESLAHSALIAAGSTAVDIRGVGFLAKADKSSVRVASASRSLAKEKHFLASES